ncbi:hypothetical protein [Haloarcula sp. JP-L23]|uniref:hypothetical protein n=1 Tax=Haloarcula sp. JP-L23 TaxID=2716717 RepID=UPI00140EC4F2|nr:hypothetical protein G9465_20410 [Haloarcula sp. JP-L23]
MTTYTLAFKPAIGLYGQHDPSVAFFEDGDLSSPSRRCGSLVRSTPSTQLYNTVLFADWEEESRSRVTVAAPSAGWGVRYTTGAHYLRTISF